MAGEEAVSMAYKLEDIPDIIALIRELQNHSNDQMRKTTNE